MCCASASSGFPARGCGRARRAARVEQGGAFEQVVERQREQPPLRDRADGMAGAADALQER